MNDSAGESLSASFTDLMTSLMVIFILLLVAATNATVHQFQQEKGKSASNRDELIGNLKKAFPNLEIDKDLNDPLAVIVVVPEGLLNFVTNRAEIPQEGQDFLQAFIPTLAGVVCAKPDMVRSVVIEGHTDEIGKDVRNVPLSQERATAVAERTLALLANSPSYGCFLGMMSASGRGKNDLIHRPDGSIDEDRSRRVEFHLRVPSFEQRNTLPAALEQVRQVTQHKASVVLKHE